MRKTLWNDLFYGARYKLHFDDAYAQNFALCPQRFPALRHLKGLSDLETLLLAWLILHIESDTPHQTFSAIEEAFRDFSPTTFELEAALFLLTSNRWVSIHLKEDTTLYFAANRLQLEKDKLYIFNPWHHLAELGLYGDICEN